MEKTIDVKYPPINLLIDHPHPTLKGGQMAQKSLGFFAGIGLLGALNINADVLRHAFDVLQNFSRARPCGLIAPLELFQFFLKHGNFVFKVQYVAHTHFPPQF
jgi:hypothetical protein